MSGASSRARARRSCWPGRSAGSRTPGSMARHLPIAVQEAGGQLRAGCRRQCVHRLPDRGRACCRSGTTTPSWSRRRPSSWAGSATGWTCRRRPRTRSPRRSCRCCPAAMRDADEDALLRPDRRERRRRGDQAVQDRHRARRRRLLPGRVPRHHPRRRWRSPGWSRNKAPVANGVPGVHFFPYSNCAGCPLGLTPRHLRDQLRRAARAGRCTTRTAAIARPAAVLVEMVQGEGGVDPGRPATSCGGCGS